MVQMVRVIVGVYHDFYCMFVCVRCTESRVNMPHDKGSATESLHESEKKASGNLEMEVRLV